MIFLRPLSIRIVLYVDNILLFAQRAAIISHLETLLLTLKVLVWLVNFENSSLEPFQKKEFIGYIITMIAFIHWLGGSCKG